ncbi:MAG: hypothetical protein ACO4AI_14820 [Prochlorothrix sp.]|nr:hypothetical protein [Prochlorothrix sp.]
MDNYTKITRALSALLTRTNPDAFVIIEHSETRKFVQFSGSVTERLCLDLPSQALSELEFYRAAQVFQSWGIVGGEQDLFDRPEGQVVGQQFSFNVECRSVEEAASLVEAIFTQVYELPADFPLTLIEH